MKISFPLSLKVLLWLLLNLVVLAAVALAFLVTQSGFGWDALVVGPSGRRLQDAANAITAELRANPERPRDELLARYSDIYDVEFALFQGGGRQLAGPPIQLPEVVRVRLAEASRLGGGGVGGGAGGGGNRGGPSGPAGPRGNGNNRGDGSPQPDGGRGPNQPRPDLRPEAALGEPFNPGPRPAAGPAAQPQLAQTFPALAGPLPSPQPAAVAPPGAQPRRPFANAMNLAGAGSRGRFLVRTQDPAGYWAGVRLPFIPDGNGGGFPSLSLVMHTASLGEMALLLDLNPWLITGAVALTLSVLFWLPLVRSITRSLGQLTRATEQIAEGRFDTRVDDARRDELGRLGGAVNRMAGQLDRAATGQKRFLGDIAHELGSPVGRLQVAVGILEERAAPALQPAVADVREEVQQMSELVGELLAFTKAGLRPRDAALARVELAPLVAEVLAREAAQGKVTVSVPAGLAAQADAALLTRAVANLVRNALRYAGDAGPIAITAQADEAEVVIAVEDSGPGVPADTLARLGEPFYRPEFARTRETGGAGLGLAIVKSAVEASRGTVRFANREPHGFRAEVRLAAG